MHECGGVDAPAEAGGGHQVPTLSVSALFLSTEPPTEPRAGLAASKLHCFPDSISHSEQVAAPCMATPEFYF